MKTLLTFILFVFLCAPIYAQTTVTLTSEAPLDGSWRNDNANTVSYMYFYVGDEDTNNFNRGFVSFDLSTIPSGANIISATLRIFQRSVEGTPYTDLGNLIVDHVDFGDILDSTDFNITPLQANIGILSTNSTIEWKELNVTTAVKDDLSNGRIHSQFRLRFPNDTDNDQSSDYVTFWASDYSDPTYHPQLVITYEAQTASVPTMNEWGIIALIILSGFSGLYYLRRKSCSIVKTIK